MIFPSNACPNAKLDKTKTDIRIRRCFMRYLLIDSAHQSRIISMSFLNSLLTILLRSIFFLSKVSPRNRQLPVRGRSVYSGRLSDCEIFHEPASKNHIPSSYCSGVALRPEIILIRAIERLSFLNVYEMTNNMPLSSTPIVTQRSLRSLSH